MSLFIGRPGCAVCMYATHLYSPVGLCAEHLEWAKRYAPEWLQIHAMFFGWAPPEGQT